MNPVLHISSIAREMSSFVALLNKTGMQSMSLRKMTMEDFSGRRAILIEAHIDQRALMNYKVALHTHLDKGGTIVFNGHLVYSIFDELECFHVAQGRGLKDLMIERVNEHPVFSGVDCLDLSLRRGVAGFYGRGANPPPTGAVALHRLCTDKSVVDWVWQRPQGGQIFMHSGNPLWMYIDDASSAARIAPQLIDWLAVGAPSISLCTGA